MYSTTSINLGATFQENLFHWLITETEVLFIVASYHQSDSVVDSYKKVTI